MKLSMINDYEVASNHFIKYKWNKFGYMNFRTFANAIKYHLNEKNEYNIRKIFNNLLSLRYIEKIKIPNKYIYKFNNPYDNPYEKKIIITFD